jgi:hypothetical protein
MLDAAADPGNPRRTTIVVWNDSVLVGDAIAISSDEVAKQIADMRRAP